MNVDNDERPVWNGSFNEALREQQLEDDSAAWRAVISLLLVIISTGLTLAVFTVWLCY